MSVKRIIRFPVKYVWIFITDECNLDCDYCFFKYRKQRLTLSFGQVKALINSLPLDKNHEFIISGGEPLLKWGIVKKTILYIKKLFPKSKLLIQSNMLLFDKNTVVFLKEMNVVVESGYDGMFLSNSLHRVGVTREKFDKIREMIGLCVRNGINVLSTMTVHPGETRNMLRNFKVISDLGVSRVDVHPAFLGKWDLSSSREFKEMYKVVLLYSVKSETKLCNCYSRPVKLSLDCILLPNGYVLPNWVYLSFSPALRKKYYILRIKNNLVESFAGRIKRLILELNNVFSRKISCYRDLSNLHAKIILKEIDDVNFNKNYAYYEDICEFVKKIEAPLNLNQ